MIAALYVQTDGCYFGLPDVDPWDEARDARTYPGPYPVVAHPPCERWGRYSTGSPRDPGRYRTGDDGGCFAAALAAVRRWGGVLEHPAASKAWDAFGLEKPVSAGGWTALDLYGGASCCVEQGHYGHAARKATWLYACGVNLPTLRWGSSQVPDPDDCPWSTSDVRTFTKPPPGLGQDWRDQRRAWLRWRRDQGLRVYATPELMSKRQRAATPIEFRDLLLSIARSHNHET